MCNDTAYTEIYTKRCSNAVEGCNQDAYYSEGLYQPWLTPDNALAAVEIGRQEVIEKAVAWLDMIYITQEPISLDDIEEFKKYMED